jgi:hypothetical protein
MPIIGDKYGFTQDNVDKSRTITEFTNSMKEMS